MGMPLIPLPVMLASLTLASGLACAGQGVVITPDDAGRFAYEDDYSTGRFVQDAFLANLPLECWTKGAILSNGPHRNRTLTYRFFGSRVLTGIHVQVEQSANARNLGGVNCLYLSPNGLDWRLVAASDSQEGDANGWQDGPLVTTPESEAALLGGTEAWVRVVLDNHSGLQTNTSNILKRLTVTLTLGGPATAAPDPQADLQQAWGQLRAAAGWRSLSLDWADPPAARPPHYYEDSDGWLQPPGGNPLMVVDEAEGFTIQRTLLYESRSPLALVTFLRTNRPGTRLLARMVIRGDADSSRAMRVLWDGEQLASFDVASYFEHDRVLLVALPVPQAGEIHELRVAGGDSGRIRLREIAVAGDGEPQWVPRPALPPDGRLQVLAAYYMPDPEPPAASQVVEGRRPVQDVGLVFEGLQRMYPDHARFGAVRVVFRNDGPVPVRIGEPVLLNGRPIQDSYVSFESSPWDAEGVVWYRVRPRLLLPGQCGQAYIRFRRAPGTAGCQISLPLENGAPLTVDVPYVQPSVSVDFVTLDASRRRLYLYARRGAGSDPGPVTGAQLDGTPLPNARIYGADFPGHVALVVADLPEPLEELAYHVAGVQTAHTSTAAQFRVLPFTFPRSSIHVPPSLCAEMHMNLAMWYQQDLETCQRYNVDTTTAGPPFDLHPRIRFILGPDEPDANDNRGGGYDRGLGYHARRLADCGWQELIERFAPHAASWIIMNGTIRPLNWCVYGQLADIACFDPYPINFYGADHAYVRESLNFVRQCGAPRPLYACLEAFGWGAGQGVPSGARGPSPEEWRQNVVQALGAGMKGLTSWVYVAGAGGWEINQPLRLEMARTNMLIEHLQAELLLGTPVDLVTSDAGLVPTGTVGDEQWPKDRVAVAALLCGPDTLVVTAANHIPASKPDPPIIEPARNVTLTVTLPDYLPSVTAFEATEEGLQPFPCDIQDRKALLRLNEIASGRVFVLRRHP